MDQENLVKQAPVVKLAELEKRAFTLIELLVVLALTSAAASHLLKKIKQDPKALEDAKKTKVTPQTLRKLGL